MVISSNRLQMAILSFIIVLIVFILILALVNARALATDRIRLTDVSVIRSALDIFYSENGFYPAATDQQPKGIEDILSFYPQQKPKGSCQNQHYNYSSKSAGADYTLSFCLGNVVGSFSAGDHMVNSKTIQ